MFNPIWRDRLTFTLTVKLFGHSKCTHLGGTRSEQKLLMVKAGDVTSIFKRSLTGHFHSCFVPSFQIGNLVPKTTLQHKQKIWSGKKNSEMMRCANCKQEKEKHVSGLKTKTQTESRIRAEAVTVSPKAVLRLNSPAPVLAHMRTDVPPRGPECIQIYSVASLFQRS